MWLAEMENMFVWLASDGNKVHSSLEVYTVMQNPK